MPKCDPQLDVLVLGEHPSAYLAAALLRLKSKFRILHAVLPEHRLRDRLVLVNPAFFSLHPLLEPLKRKLQARSVYGLQFLADDPQTRSEYRSKSAVGSIAHLKDLRSALEGLARAQGVEFLAPKPVQLHRVDEKGIELTVGNLRLCPKALVLACELPAAHKRILGIPEEWERGILRRYSFVRLKPGRSLELSARALMPMSLNLRGTLGWAWLLPSDRFIQLAIEQTPEQLQRAAPVELLNHWAQVLFQHQVLRTPLRFAPEQVESIDMPMAGALAHEGLANHTLLIGPAGGFYSGSAEDVYPTCWSAIHAADTLKKALKEPHLQDALQPYRQRWRTTLGDYLRGPQQNLRFLLPLVYRNQVMTNRLAEAILTGKSVVR